MTPHVPDQFDRLLARAKEEARTQDEYLAQREEEKRLFNVFLNKAEARGETTACTFAHKAEAEGLLTADDRKRLFGMRKKDTLPTEPPLPDYVGFKTFTRFVQVFAAYAAKSVGDIKPIPMLEAYERLDAILAEKKINHREIVLYINSVERTKEELMQQFDLTKNQVTYQLSKVRKAWPELRKFKAEPLDELKQLRPELPYKSKPGRLSEEISLDRGKGEGPNKSHALTQY